MFFVRGIHRAASGRHHYVPPHGGLLHTAASGHYHCPPYRKHGTPLINFAAVFLATAITYTMTRDYRGVTKREEEMRIERENYAEDLKKLRKELDARCNQIP